jgi:hypothetical protein
MVALIRSKAWAATLICSAVFGLGNSSSALAAALPGVNAVESSTSLKSVTLVIDYGAGSKLATKVVDLTDIPSSTSGWALFSLARQRVQGTQQFPIGFVCRINGWPTVTRQNCAGTPAYRDGHWAYYVTNYQLGQGWILSGQGAATHIPDCGSYEGWSWIPGGQPNRPPRYKAETRACK